MTNQNRIFDAQLCQRCVQQTRLDFDVDVAVIRPVAVTVTGAIESNGAVMRRERAVEFRPVLTGTGIAVNQDDRTAGAFDYEVQARVFDSDEFRNRLRMMVTNAGSKVSLFEWAGDSHKLKAPSLTVGLLTHGRCAAPG